MTEANDTSGKLTESAAAPHTMKVDLPGRLRNTPVPIQHAFLPLFEAVVNSIHATEDRFGDDVSQRGSIEVRIRREPQQQLPGMPGRPPAGNITALIVLDNGVGFTEGNQAAFETADSTAKVARGGKGVGRFTWLVVFDHVVVSSVYSSASGERRRRSFDFRPTGTGVVGHADIIVSEEEPWFTSVALVSPKKKYVSGLRKTGDVVAERLFEHCFNTIVLGRCPTITIIDELPDGEERFVVNDRLAELTLAAPEPLLVGGHSLEVRHVQQPHKSGRKHEAHLCAHERVVTSFSLAQVSDLGAEPLRQGDQPPVVHHVFVIGKALDEAVDPTRTRLDLPDGQPILEEAGELDLQALRTAIGEHVNERLREVLAEERAENFKRVESHVRTVQPEYRHLLDRCPDQLARLKWTDNRQQLDEALYRIQQGHEAAVRQRQAQVEKKLVDDSTELEKVAEELYRVVSETNEAGQANLVRYVTKRRAVLQLLEKMISRFEGPALEEHIHRIVFPLRKTGDEVAADDHNLWLVDDSLAFYEHLSSDLELTKSAAVPADSKKRPDILGFKTGSPYQHIAIVEFKRPDREDSDPVRQLVEYAQLLREGGRVNAAGQTLPGIPTAVRIDAYAVLTLTPKVEKALQLAPGDLKRVEAEWRWYGYHTDLNVSIEVLDYQAFIRRARQRNQSFFTKLGLGPL